MTDSRTVRRPPASGGGSLWSGALLAAISVLASGCYAPLHSPGVRAPTLPDVFRTPIRSGAPRLNLADLTVVPPSDYLLGPYDTLEVSVPRLFEGADLRVIQVQVMSNGTVTLPLAGDVSVGGMTLAQASHAIAEAYQSYLSTPQVSVNLLAKATVEVTVIGEVDQPGVYPLPKYQNDIAHALAAAGGLSEFAGQKIEVHRRMRERKASGSDDLAPLPPVDQPRGMREILQIPLRGAPPSITTQDGMVWVREPLLPEDILLEAGDVVFVPRQQDEVFFVTGELDETRVVNFRVQERDRQLGNAFLLPPDRDIDVVTAVAMAGYIDPIDSPTTVTVHRSVPFGPPLLVHVDLIKARYDWSENLYVQAGDILYLNPDPSWWMRRTFDRIVPDLLTLPYREAMQRWINPSGLRR